MKKVMLATLAGCALSLAAGPFALAHTDSHGDGGSACDTWDERGGHHFQGDAQHSQASAVDGTTVHMKGGHYGVRGNSYYVDVVGGNGYNKGNGNQGGFVQAEVDHASVPVDADLHAGTYAGTAAPFSEANGCVSVANTKVGDPGPDPHPNG